MIQSRGFLVTLDKNKIKQILGITSPGLNIHFVSPSSTFTNILYYPLLLRGEEEAL